MSAGYSPWIPTTRSVQCGMAPFPTDLDRLLCLIFVFSRPDHSAAVCICVCTCKFFFFPLFPSHSIPGGQAIRLDARCRGGGGGWSDGCWAEWRSSLWWPTAGAMTRKVRGSLGPPPWFSQSGSQPVSRRVGMPRSQCLTVRSSASLENERKQTKKTA